MENNTVSPLPDIRQTLVVKAPIQKVWNAVATSEGIAAWFMPNDFQAVEGYEFHLNAAQFGMSPCKVIKVDEPNLLSFNWGKDWQLSFELKEVDAGQTEITLIHSGWDANKLTEFGAPHGVIRETMAMGWAGMGNKLGAYLEA